jgi:hypothetical protein
LRRPVFATLLNDRPGPLRLLSGNAHCAVPSYDLAALRRDLRVVPLVKVEAGALTANPRFTAPDPFALLAAGTTPLDVSAWRFRKAVKLAATGWQQLDLDLDVLARCTANFADLRLLAVGQQVPFVLERLPTSRSFAVAARAADDPKRAKTSLWQLTLPQKNLPLTRLTCETSAPLFRREIAVFEERADARGEKHRVPLGSATWQRTPEQKPGKLVVTLNEPPRSDALVLEVDNGDNPPLALTGFTAWHPTGRLHFRAPDGATTALYYGNVRATAPRYDLALIANQFFAAPQAQARLGPEEILQPKPLAEALAGEPGNAVFWAVLVLVVLGLLFALHRLLPKPAEPGK